MTISVGDRLPEATLFEMAEGQPATIASGDVFAGKTVALFGLPGAYTGTCSRVHMPSFVAAAGQLRAKGVDAVVCLTVNDPFVASAWGEATGATAEDIRIVADPFAELTKKMGLDYDGSARGLGVRCRRFSALVKNGEVTILNLEEAPGQAVCSVGEVLVDQI
ncbi:MAG TPA: peroxiredoxin [Thermohalobaculum sp.]|nr:peroxiredoxin [Thermohalobaculum sp.]